MPDMPQIPRVEARVVHHGGVPVTHTGRGRRETVKLAATAAQSIAPVDLTGGDVPRVELHGGDAEVDGAAARGGRRDAVPGVARARTDVTGCAVSNIRTAVTERTISVERTTRRINGRDLTFAPRTPPCAPQARSPRTTPPP